MPKKIKKKKHIPQRTCVGCREVLPKRSLVRIVRSADAVNIDSTGKMPGRGSYLHDKRQCWERGLKGSLANALKTEFTEADLERLLAFMQTLPESSMPEMGAPSARVQADE